MLLGFFFREKGLPLFPPTFQKEAGERGPGIKKARERLINKVHFFLNTYLIPAPCSLSKNQKRRIKLDVASYNTKGGYDMI